MTESWQWFVLCLVVTFTACANTDLDGSVDAGPDPDGWISPWSYPEGGNVWFDGSSSSDSSKGTPDQSPSPDSRIVFADSTMTPGSQSCYTIMSCSQSCMDSACVMGCLQSGTSVAQQQFITLNNCLGAAVQAACSTCNTNPMSQNCQTCLTQTCATEITTCTGMSPPLPDAGVGSDLPAPGDGAADGPAAGWSCGQVTQCIGSCNQADQLCYDGCMVKGSAAAQTQFKLMVSCLNGAYYGSCATPCANPNATTCDSCLTAACSSELTVCSP